MFYKKRFYNRETITMLNYTTPNVFHTSLPFYTTKIISSFLNSSISANHDNVDQLSTNGKGVVSLLKNIFVL